MSAYFPLPAHHPKVMFEIYRLTLVTGGGLGLINMAHTFEWGLFYTVSIPGAYTLITALYTNHLERKAVESDNAKRDGLRVH